MSFLWPSVLWCLLALPLLIGSYVLLLKRRKKFALKYSGLALVKQAQGRWAGVRRHVPPALFLVAVAAMLLAAARPVSKVTLPSQNETVILALDVSGSMRAVDVKPSRLAAAQDAARTFINETPNTTKIGIVEFAGAASLVQPPTRNREDVLAAIDRMELQRGTAVGSGILVALKAIFPTMEIDLRATSNPRGARSASGRPLFNAPPGTEEKKDDEFKPVPPGSYNSAVIILLTDGQTTTGIDPVEAAKTAADRGVRVYTVGIGTPNGEIVVGDGWTMRVRLDEQALKSIANITQAEYFYAGTAAELKKVYQTLNSKLVLETTEMEVASLFAAAAALLAVLSALLSTLWYGRVF